MDKLTMDECLTEMRESGSETAFEKLYLHSRSGVYAFIYSLVENEFDAEDIMQQTYVLVRTNVDKYKSGTNAKAWVLEIAKNTAKNFIKKRRRETPFSDAGNEILNIACTDADGSYGDLIDVIERTLDERSRQIVFLHLVTGLKHSEIAKMLNIPLGTVLWKYNKAIKRLRQKLREIEYYED